MIASAELVDVLNDHGDVIGVTTRSDMRARKLPHRCVYVLVFGVNGKLLIHQRTATKDVFPSHWDVCVGGVLSAGESFDDSARRETLEEIGVTGSFVRLFPFNYADGNTKAFGMVYRLVHNGPFQPQPEEVAQLEWIEPEAVEARLAAEPFCPDGAAIWRLYRDGAST